MILLLVQWLKEADFYLSSVSTAKEEKKKKREKYRKGRKIDVGELS